MGVVRLEITRREPVLGGAPFKRVDGAGSTYEKLEGVLHFSADPVARANEPIADLGLAPRNARGLVEYSADFYLLRPLDGGRGRLLLDVPNRGRKIALGMFNSTPRSNDPASREDFGNQFLMRHGYTVAWIGWQPDVPRRDGMMAMTVPRVASVSERVRCEFRPNARVDVLPLADRYHIPHPVARLDDPEAELHVREHADAHRGHGAALGLALPGHRVGRARRRLPAGPHLRLLLPRAGPAGGRARLHRGTRHRELPALGHRP
jgi:hypothetical protein